MTENDTDSDLPAQTLTVINPGNLTSALGVPVTITSTGSFTYNPTATAAIQSLRGGETTNDSFTYSVQDNGTGPSNLVSNVATVSIVVTGINDAPVANNDVTALGSKDLPVAVRQSLRHGRRFR